MFSAKMNIITEDNTNDRVLQVRYYPTSINLEDREAEAFIDDALKIGKKIVVSVTPSPNGSGEKIATFKVVDV